MMPSQHADVTPLELPEWLNPYVVFVSFLNRRGIWEEIPRRLRVNRQGYQGIDVFMVLLAYWTSHHTWSLKEFIGQTKRYGPQLASVAGRESWPTQSSISRALGDFEVEDVRWFNQWFFEQLRELAEPLLVHRAGYHIDANGKQVRAFYADGKLHALRRRALPEGEEYPPPRRMVTKLGAPGRTGRKRGEVVYTITAMQDAGTGLWTGVEIGEGSGKLPAHLEDLTPEAERWVRRLGESPRQAYVLTDGESGGRTQAIIGTNSEIGFGTRLSCYELLDNRGVRSHLNAAEWNRVPDAASGPVRFAAEMGTIRLGGQQLRVVVSRFDTNQNSTRGCGREIDGYNYELFGFEKGSERSIPAAEAVTMYYGRNGIENSFSQKEHEFGSSRIRSDNTGGQYLAESVGFASWNLETLVGARLEQPLEETTISPEERRYKPVQLPAMPINESEDSKEPDIQQTVQITDGCVGAILAAQNWEQRLKEGWEFDEYHDEIICPAGQRLRHQSTSVSKTRVGLRFRGSWVTCSNCPLRDECANSDADRFRKELRISRRIEDIDDEYLQPVSSQYDWTPPDEQPTAHEESSAPDQTVRKPRLVPGYFRKHCRQYLKQLMIAIALGEPSSNDEPTPLYLLSNDGERQRRRQTWEQRLQYNESLRDHTIIITGDNPELTERLDRLLSPGKFTQTQGGSAEAG